MGIGASLRMRPVFAVSLIASVAVHALILRALPPLERLPAVPAPPLEVVLVQPPVPLPAAAMPETETRVVTRHERASPRPRRRVTQPKTDEHTARAPEPLPAAPVPPIVTAPDIDSAPVPAQSASAVPARPGRPSNTETTPAEARFSPRPAPAIAPSFSAAYLRNPPPRYPPIARRNGEQGTVTLRVLVTRTGEPGSVTLEKTSGSAILDAAALETVKQWRFVPAQQDGEPVDASVLVPIVFRLREVS